MTGSGDERRPRVLDPVERLSEVLFGILMAMTFTASVRAAEADATTLRTMLYAAVGCNVAWGVVDAVMYLMTSVIGRDRARALLRQLHAARDDEERRRRVADALPEGLAQAMRPAELEALSRSVARLPVPAGGARIERQELQGAAGVFLLVSLSTFPLVLVGEPALALRISHGTGLVMLYLVGSAFGRYAGRRPLVWGASMVAIGVSLVLLTMALGG